MSTLLRVGSVAVGVLLALALILYLTFPDVSSLNKTNPKQTAMMRHRGGTATQYWVPISRIAPALRKLVVYAEDGTFYQHEGIDLQEMKKSIEKNVKKGRFARGGSTITMQLARNLYLWPEKTLSRKFLEILIAYRMDQVLSKQRILEIYLNVIEWGRGIYGAEAASQHYFGKPAASLTDEEAAFLTAIIPNPVKWGHWPPGPYVQNRIDFLKERL